MIKEDKNLTGNSKYEGFCIDLLHRIASQVGFHYAITLVPDNKYGAYDPATKQWNGIVRELMDKVILQEKPRPTRLPARKNTVKRISSWKQ